MSYVDSIIGVNRTLESSISDDRIRFVFWKCHGEMDLKGMLNTAFLHVLPNFCHV